MALINIFSDTFSLFQLLYNFSILQTMLAIYRLPLRLYALSSNVVFCHYPLITYPTRDEVIVIARILVAPTHDEAVGGGGGGVYDAAGINGGGDVNGAKTM